MHCQHLLEILRYHAHLDKRILLSTQQYAHTNARKGAQFCIRRLKRDVWKVSSKVNHVLARPFGYGQDKLGLGAQLPQHAENGILVAFGGGSVMFGFGEHCESFPEGAEVERLYSTRKENEMGTRRSVTMSHARRRT